MDITAVSAYTIPTVLLTSAQTATPRSTADNSINFHTNFKHMGSSLRRITTDKKTCTQYKRLKDKAE